MSKVLPSQGSAADWLATLQEAHRYIIHYSTVRLSLVTFLVTAMFTALLYGLPKETVVVTQDSILSFSGKMNTPAIAVSLLLFLSALSLNRIFDRRRYMMERFASDVEIVLNAKIVNGAQTAREHQLDQLGTQDVNVILTQTKISSLQTAYENGYRCYFLYGRPGLNAVITWAFLLAFIGIVFLVAFSYVNANKLTQCVRTGKSVNCTTTVMRS